MMSPNENVFRRSLLSFFLFVLPNSHHPELFWNSTSAIFEMQKKLRTARQISGITKKLEVGLAFWNLFVALCLYNWSIKSTPPNSQIFTIVTCSPIKRNFLQSFKSHFPFLPVYLDSIGIPFNNGKFTLSFRKQRKTVFFFFSIIGSKWSSFSEEKEEKQKSDHRRIPNKPSITPCKRFVPPNRGLTLIFFARPDPPAAARSRPLTSSTASKVVSHDTSIDVLKLARYEEQNVHDMSYHWLAMANM